jgi:hypothetical protein
MRLNIKLNNFLIKLKLILELIEQIDLKIVSYDRLVSWAAVDLA